MVPVPPSFREEWCWFVWGPKSPKTESLLAHAGCESRPHVWCSPILLRRMGSGELHTDYLRLEVAKASLVKAYLIDVRGDARKGSARVLAESNYPTRQ